MSDPRLIEKPEWFVKMLLGLAEVIEREVRDLNEQGRPMDKYQIGAWSQRRENLKYTARFISQHFGCAEGVTERSESSGSLPSAAQKENSTSVDLLTERREREKKDDGARAPVRSPASFADAGTETLPKREQ